VVHKMSYVNILRQEAATRNDVGIANWFVSHSWKATFADTVNSILDFFQNDNDAVVWFDVFCDCQHRTGGASKPSEWYMVRECAYSKLSQSQPCLFSRRFDVPLPTWAIFYFQ
jgi:hypothetical protein